MQDKRGRLLCYTLMASIILVLTGFLAVGVRAFESAGVSNFLFFVVAGLFVLAPVFYFVGRPIAHAAERHKIFEQARTERFTRDRREPAHYGQEKAAIAIERRGKQRSRPLAPRSE